MDQFNNVKNFCEQHSLACVIVVVLVLIIVYLYMNKEAFANAFVPAPIAVQRPQGVLGVGQAVRFSPEFSSTNQGLGNLISDSLAARENMVGNMEPQVPLGISSELERSQVKAAHTKPENFSARSMYAEFYKNNTDERLKEILQGH